MKKSYQNFIYYSKKYKKLADLPEGAIIAIPNDPTNEGRALLLLAEAGLITLKADAGITATVQDIVNNPLKLKFSEKKDDIQHKLDSRQVFLTVEIEKLRNERSYWIAVLKKTEDIDALKNCRDQIDLLTLRMGDLEQRKVDLDRERKATINILKREYYEQVAALEAQYSQEGGEA